MAPILCWGAPCVSGLVLSPEKFKFKWLPLYSDLNVRFATIPSTNSLFRSHPKGAHRTVTLLRNKYVVPLNGRGVVK